MCLAEWEAEDKEILHRFDSPRGGEPFARMECSECDGLPTIILYPVEQGRR